ncbi:siderophore ABC transporter substrate-binding protein [Helcococcus massiliensis]|uniref:siderophore ABC transporter substrate-binding protein n=1 Tax=Helcococcus massiliensis TaxID=2040290 RepID=UPI000CDEDD87|nr:ABC transporter substrate-binding protein [Helcococcus massiliensis]
MKKKLLVIALLLSLMLTACSNKQGQEVNTKDETNAESSTDTVKIKDLTGELEVRKNPKKVAALDNRTFETLENWGIKLVAAPKAVMPSTSGYITDEAIADIGNHREPNLEALAAANPDLVIVGQRFGSHYDEIKKLLPKADIINLNWDVSKDAEKPGENLINGFKDSIDSLGAIFDKKAEADELKKNLDNSITKAKEAYKGGSVVSVVVSGGEIGYSAPGFGRVWGPLFQVLDLTPAIEIDNTSSDHKGDEISVEAIAQANPKYLLVLDRDAATTNTGEESIPASDVIEGSQALKNVEAIKDSNIYYAPADTFTNESPQTFIKIFEGLADLFSK